MQRVRDLASKAIVADGTDKEIMDQIGIHEDDTVIISFGEDLAAATLITLHLKQLKVKSIIVKAPNEEHKMILEKVGATDVIIPEKEIANKVARSLISPNVFDYLPLSEDYMIYEMAPPESFLGKSIAELAAALAVQRHGDRRQGHLERQGRHSSRLPVTSSRTARCMILVGKVDDIGKIR